MLNYKKAKKIICASLVFCMIFCISMAAFAETFSDINGHWAKGVIEKWAGRNVIKGYDGKFMPDDNIIRGDFALILSRIIEFDKKAENNFVDLNSDDYYADAILKLNYAGIMQGDGDTVRPNDNLTREEAFVLICRAYGFSTVGVAGDADVKFADKADISDWAYDAVIMMCLRKIVNGSDDNKIHPQDSITRAEVIKILDNIELMQTAVEAPEEIEIITDENFLNPGGGSGYHGTGSGGGTGGGGGSEQKDNIEVTDDTTVEESFTDVGGIW